MDGRLTLTDCDEAGDYVVHNVLILRSDLTTWTKLYHTPFFFYCLRLIENIQLLFHTPPHIHIGLYVLYIAKKALKTNARLPRMFKQGLN